MNIKLGTAPCMAVEAQLAQRYDYSPSKRPYTTAVQGVFIEAEMEDRFIELMRKFDEHYTRMVKIIAQIEHAEKKREIERELDYILDTCNINKANSNERKRDWSCRI